eukprot:gene7697-9468_t
MIENFEKFKTYLYPTCTNTHTYKLLCNHFFQPCETVPLDGSDGYTSLSLNQRPCNEDCTLAIQECGPLAVPFLPCASSYTDDPTIKLYPTSSNNYNLQPYGGPSFNIKCLDVDTISSGNQTTLPPIVGGDICVSPLIYRNSSVHNRKQDIDDGYFYLGETDCLMPCPAVFFTDQEWDNFQLMVDIVGIVSFVGSFFNLFTYGVINKKHDRHSIGILFLSLSIFMMLLADMISTGMGFKLVCPTEERYARQFDAACAANGIIFQYGAVSSVLWWSTMAFDLWMVIKKVNPIKTYIKYYIIVINILSIIFTIIPIFDKQYGYAMGGLGCWILENGWQNGVFWIPLSVCLFFGTAFIILILYEIYKIVSSVGRGATRLIKLNLRPFLIILFIFSDKVYDYVKCLYLNGSDEQCSIRTVPYTAQFVFLFFLRLLGIEVMIFYGFNSRTKKIWQDSIVLNNKYYKFFKSRLTSMSGTTTTKYGGATTTNKHSSDNHSSTTVSNIRSINTSNDDADTDGVSIELSNTNTAGSSTSNDNSPPN